MDKLCIDGWAGRQEIDCVVIRETAKRFRIKLEQDCKLPGRYRWGVKGQEISVPKYSIRREREARMDREQEMER